MIRGALDDSNNQADPGNISRLSGRVRLFMLKQSFMNLLSIGLRSQSVSQAHSKGGEFQTRGVTTSV